MIIRLKKDKITTNLKTEKGFVVIDQNCFA